MILFTITGDSTKVGLWIRCCCILRFDSASCSLFFSSQLFRNRISSALIRSDNPSSGYTATWRLCSSREKPNPRIYTPVLTLTVTLGGIHILKPKIIESSIFNRGRLIIEDWENHECGRSFFIGPMVFFRFLSSKFFRQVVPRLWYIFSPAEACLPTPFAVASSKPSFSL